ncbi:zinc-binding alcohol dehydrogenase family protein [Oceaniserpentilla sp. 4NH20-0058]|uniref:zinc-binding alcohol dehydrogenase family protein n=1 Tax=Oceaniserpentilla sp. 4NH20-0058 TaxID=3127660 RepID=UPI00310BD5D5
MKAIAFDLSLPIADDNSLFELQQPKPKASGHDLLVKIDAISVNPVDAKIRMRARPEKAEPKVLGYDAVGTVEEIGENCTLFNVGDVVFYAGDMNRQGSNAEYQLVDERLVGKAPNTLDSAQTAALPLTSLTAYEMLFDRLQIDTKRPFQSKENSLLITAGAGGVGSIMIQLVKALCPDVTVIATASRPESQQWCKTMGADYVINHTNGIASEFESIGIKGVSHIASITHSHSHFDDFAQIIQPQGKICLIDDPATPLNIQQLKAKSVSLHWELMFTRSLFQTDDMIRQHHILNQVAQLVDEGKVGTTLGKHLGKINVDNLKTAHALAESSQSIGKLVLEGF